MNVSEKDKTKDNEIDPGQVNIKRKGKKSLQINIMSCDREHTLIMDIKYMMTASKPT